LGEDGMASEDMGDGPNGTPKTTAKTGPGGSGPTTFGSAGGSENWTRWGVYIAAAGLVIALLTWLAPIESEDNPRPPTPPSTTSPAKTLSPAEVTEQLLLAAKAGNFTEIGLFICQREHSGFLSGSSYYQTWQGLQQTLNNSEAQPQWRITDEKIHGRDASLKVYISALDSAGKRQEVPDPMQFRLVDEQGWKICDVYAPYA
jgi:hypothetical protein